MISKSRSRAFRQQRRKTAMVLLALLALIFTVGATGFSQDLEMHFIGNMAFRISDGETTLLSDFPYQSGAFGYNTYDPAEVRDYGSELALITHFHGDHWLGSLFAETDWALIAPKHVLAKVESDAKIAFASTMQFGGLVIEAYATEHNYTKEHYSYLVRWPRPENGDSDGTLRLYFTGDTESTEQLLEMRDLHVAFVSPWLLRAVAAAGKTIDAKRVMVYHHTTGEEVIDYQGRILPTQGEAFKVPFPAVK